jgi:hypothetical protein
MVDRIREAVALRLLLRATGAYEYHVRTLL